MAAISPRFLVAKTKAKDLKNGVSLGTIPAGGQIVQIFVHTTEDFDYDASDARDGITIQSNQAPQEIVALGKIPLKKKDGAMTLTDVGGYQNTPYPSDASLTAQLFTRQGTKGEIIIAIGFV